MSNPVLGGIEKTTRIAIALFIVVVLVLVFYFMMNKQTETGTVASVPVASVPVAAPVASVPVAPPPLPPLLSEPIYLGCYRDNQAGPNGQKQRALPLQLGDKKKRYTFSQCLKLVKDKGLTYMGLQYPKSGGNQSYAQCWGGNANAQYDMMGTINNCYSAPNGGYKISTGNGNAVYRIR
jgi:hypothetical protein